MLFRDRGEAAQKLAAALDSWRGNNPLVLGIPRGAVPMARAIAERLGGEVDAVLVRKLRAPGNPEYAIGSIDESGWSYVAPYAES
ncbi:MAG: phosphoribosyltransferase family protein, partial [Burkholderiales bacterium]